MKTVYLEFYILILTSRENGHKGTQRRKSNDVCFTAGDNFFGMTRFCNHPHRLGRYLGLRADSSGKRHLISGLQGYFLVRIQGARADIDEITSQDFFDVNAYFSEMAATNRGR